MRALPCSRRPLGAALALGPTILARAEAEAAPWIVASVVSGPAILLGAAQRAGRVVDLAACTAASAPVLRRATTGTAAYLPGTALIWALALPHIGALIQDARPATLLNRNVRPFLHGFARAGASAHYFGRESITIDRSPGALLGFDVAPSGAVLIEVIAGYDESIAIPTALTTLEERSVDRWRGKAPTSLAGRPGAPPPIDYAEAVIAGVAERAGLSLEPMTAPELDPPAPLVLDPNDPIASGFVVAAPIRCPIGWIDAASALDGAVWVGGDVLAPRHTLEAIARTAAPPGRTEAPIQGARWQDMIEAAARAALTHSSGP